MGWTVVSVGQAASGVPDKMALGAHNPAVRPHPGGCPRLQRSGSSPQQMTGTPRPPEPWTRPQGVGTGQGPGWTRGSVAISQTAVVGEDALWPEDRR